MSSNMNDTVHLSHYVYHSLPCFSRLPENGCIRRKILVKAPPSIADVAMSSPLSIQPWI